MLKTKFKPVLLLVLVTIYPIDALSDYLFIAPPRESTERGVEIYKPIADFLTKSTGERFTYRHPKDWAEYSRGMQNGQYDLVFDGPHFVSWRIHNAGHDVVVKLPQLHIWRVIVKTGQDDIQSLNDLIGKQVCAPKSPNFGMLTMMSHYTNPEKEPVHVITKGWKGGFDSVVQGKCVATVLPITNHKKFDPEQEKTRVIHTHLPYPNQAFTVGPRVPPTLKSKITRELLSDQGQNSLLMLRDRYAGGTKLVSAENEEYEGISMMLKRADNFRDAED